MAALEVCINGNSLDAVESGDFGGMSANITWIRIQQKSGKIIERANIFMFATHGGEATQQQSVALKTGDEITIRIVDRQQPLLPVNED